MRQAPRRHSEAACSSQQPGCSSASAAMGHSIVNHGAYSARSHTGYVPTPQNSLHTHSNGHARAQRERRAESAGRESYRRSRRGESAGRSSMREKSSSRCRQNSAAWRNVTPCPSARTTCARFPTRFVPHAAPAPLAAGFASWRAMLPLPLSLHPQIGNCESLAELYLSKNAKFSRLEEDQVR